MKSTLVESPFGIANNGSTFVIQTEAVIENGILSKELIILDAKISLILTT